MKPSVIICTVRLLGWAGATVFWLCLAAGSAALAQNENESTTSRGTVNILLANANGIVLLTDSVDLLAAV